MDLKKIFFTAASLMAAFATSWTFATGRVTGFATGRVTGFATGRVTGFATDIATGKWRAADPMPAGMTAYTSEQAAESWPQSVVPGFDSIVHDPAAWRQVVDKFSAAQVRASLTDCIIAYYGFALQPGFNPDPSDGQATLEENMHQAIMADDYATAYTFGQEILKYRPMDLTTLYWTLFAATETNQSWETRNSLRGRYNSISHIISLSGNGLTSETAFRVISSGDMYTYTMLELGLEIGEGFLWDNRWTEFRVTPLPTGGDARSTAGSGERFRGSSIFFEIFPGEN